MPSIRLSTLVHAPPSQVFAVFTDFARAPERVRAIQSVELLSEGPLRVGARIRETREVLGRRAVEELELVEFEPGRSYALACDSCGARFRSRFEFAPVAEGTRVDVLVEATALTLFARLLAPLSGWILRQSSSALAQDLQDLRAACEAR